MERPWSERIKEFISNHRELVYAVLALLVLYVSYEHVIPRIDPRIAFDGWSDVLYLELATVKGFLVVLFAWMSKKATHGELSALDDEWVRGRIMRGGDQNNGALKLYVLEMVSTAFWVLVWAYFLFRKG